MKETIAIETLIKAGFNFNGCKFDVNDSGVDFKVIHIMDGEGYKWIVKIPRRIESMRNAMLERQLLDRIRNEVDFEIPAWEIIDNDLIVYKQLNGFPLAHINIKEQKYDWNLDPVNIPDNYLTSFSKALVKLHHINYEMIGSIGIKKIENNHLRDNMKQRIDRVNQNYEINPDLLRRWKNWVNDSTYWPTHIGLAHGDLHPGHILLNENYCLCGIIDWSESFFGDVSVDFLSHYLLLGENVLDRIITSYSNLGGITWNKMKEHIIELLTTSPITVAEYAEVSGLEKMKVTAQNMLLNP